MGLFTKRKQEPESGSATEVILDDGQAIAVNNVVDCIGDSCPRPQLMTKSALNKASSGFVLDIHVDNPTSMEALPAVIAENGGTHLATLRQKKYWQVLARKT